LNTPNNPRTSLWISYFSLFTSVGTLFCCALPSLLVVLGMGASLAGLIGFIPQLVWISEYKVIVFSVSGLMIGLSAWWTYQSRNNPCPIDPELARACSTSRTWSIWILSFSALVWTLGFVFAFVAPVLL
jgi:hypothetical protein